MRGSCSPQVHYYNEISTSISAGLFLAAVQWAGLVTLTRRDTTTTHRNAPHVEFIMQNYRPNKFRV